MIAIRIISFALLTTFTKVDHAVYISVLEFNSQEMKIKVFTDNLNDALKNDENTIEGYFQKKIKLRINKQNIDFSLEEVLEVRDSHWITFRLEAPEKWNSFYLEASYFMELFVDQTNVVKVLGENPKFFRLTKLKPNCSFSE